MTTVDRPTSGPIHTFENFKWS